MSKFYRWHDHTLTVFCHLQPKASRDEFAGCHSERLKIRIEAAPIDGKANTQLIAFLAKQFGVARQAITISSGALGRQKTVIIDRPRQLPVRLAIERP